MDRSIAIPERIEGSRVSLRPISERDIAPWADAFSTDKELGPAWGIEEDLDEEGLRRHMTSMAEAAEAGRAVEMVIAANDDDRLLGSVILHSFDWRHGHTEVGFWLLAQERGEGSRQRGSRADDGLGLP